MEWKTYILPDEKVYVLAYCPKGNLGNPFMCVAYRVGMKWFDFDDDRYIDTPMPITHWMPLPEPPSAGVVKNFAHEPTKYVETEALNKHDVDGLSELLLAFLQHMEDYGPWEFRDKTGTVQQFLEGKQ